MRRREFLGVLGGVAVGWPLAAQGQGRVRRIGVLMPFSADDRNARVRYSAFLQALQQLGWSEGRNVQLDVRWAPSNAEVRKHAAELVAHAPDLIFTSGSVSMGILAQIAGADAVPTVFAIVPDPVGAGYVASLARPGGNATGFTPFEYGIGGKWLELLRELRPTVSRAGIIRDPTVSAGIGLWGAIQAVAPLLGIDIFPVDVRATAEIERAAASLASTGNGGLIVTGSFTAIAQRDPIIALAARYKVPTIYYDRYFSVAGGLISYGPDLTDQFRRGQLC